MRTREHALTLSDVLLPRATVWRDLALILAFSVFTTLAAYIAIRLPFSPVPITAQTLAVLMAGAVLGSRRGALSQLAYIGQGLIGLPVFAGGGFGLAHVLGPTGGYLWGFVVAAYLVGRLAEMRWDRRPATMAGAMLVGNLAIYLFGVLWLSLFLQADLSKGIMLGLLPYIPGDVVKIIVATTTLPSAWALLRR